jgi:hypothetical protein
MYQKWTFSVFNDRPSGAGSIVSAGGAMSQNKQVAAAIGRLPNLDLQGLKTLRDNALRFGTDAAPLVKSIDARLPVVETCLSLPPAQLFRGPRDRGLARMAFRERLPASILDRQTKGEMSAIYGRHIADNLSILRPWLLNGRLAAEGIIDRRLADTVLSHEHLIWQGTYADIMTAAAIEGWVRVWEARLGPHRRQGFLPAS